MINQSIHFNISGKEADALMTACIAQGITPVQAFEQFIYNVLPNNRSSNYDLTKHDSQFSTNNPVDTQAEYNQETVNFLLSSDKNKDYQSFKTVDALFADLEED
ncbi:MULTISPECIES: hypothetical protein [unclassified Moraxella]|uniref:hypothetical protein n=1 Tax=unclassified Moraxella TaxID=2685852 RepID=UPI003AF462ED